MILSNPQQQPNQLAAAMNQQAPNQPGMMSGKLFKRTSMYILNATN